MKSHHATVRHVERLEEINNQYCKLLGTAYNDMDGVWDLEKQDTHPSRGPNTKNKEQPTASMDGDISDACEKLIG